MVVNINEPGRYIKLRDIHDLPGLVSRDVFLNGSDLAIENTDISHFVNVIRRVDHVAALQQQVVTSRGLSKHHDRKCEDDGDERNDCQWRLNAVLHRVSLVESKRKCIYWT